MPAAPAADDRPPVRTDAITRWLLLVAVLIVVMVLVGGFTRLSRAGLSIVEWDAVTGAIPPIGQRAWEESFAAYQQTPEYRLVNAGMSLAEYQRIFYIEWAHRLIARIAGLLVVAPLVWFLWRKRLTLRASLPYWGIAILFGIQGAIGWVMVSSGLKDRPVVSHFRLTIHLLTALALLALVLWMALGRMRSAAPPPRDHDAVSGGPRMLSWILLGAVIVQISFGGLVAVLKAGHVSNTWPLMFGRLVPAGLLATADTWWAALAEPLGSHWIHRWFAFVVAALAIGVAVVIRRSDHATDLARGAAGWLLAAVAVQISLGIGVVIFGVPLWLALAHQGIGVLVFVLALVIVHETSARTRTAATPVPVG